MRALLRKVGAQSIVKDKALRSAAGWTLTKAERRYRIILKVEEIHESTASS